MGQERRRWMNAGGSRGGGQDRWWTEGAAVFIRLPSGRRRAWAWTCPYQGLFSVPPFAVSDGPAPASCAPRGSSAAPPRYAADPQPGTEQRKQVNLCTVRLQTEHSPGQSVTGGRTHQLGLSLGDLAVILLQDFLQLLPFRFFFFLDRRHRSVLVREEAAAHDSSHTPTHTISLARPHRLN